MIFSCNSRRLLGSLTRLEDFDELGFTSLAFEDSDVGFSGVEMFRESFDDGLIGFVFDRMLCGFYNYLRRGFERVFGRRDDFD